MSKLTKIALVAGGFALGAYGGYKAGADATEQNFKEFCDKKFPGGHQGFLRVVARHRIERLRTEQGDPGIPPHLAEMFRGAQVMGLDQLPEPIQTLIKGRLRDLGVDVDG